MKSKTPEKEIENYIEGTATAEEKALVDAWYEKIGDEKSNLDPKEDPREIEERILMNVFRQVKPKPFKKFAIAASILLALSFSLVLYKINENNSATPTLTDLVQYDVEPGGNKATLTLADGSTINLSDNQKGIIIGTEDNIKYNDGSFVIQSDSEGSLSARQASTPIQYLNLTTPKRGKYQITLPDGTKVWLNAASTLKYPRQFSGKERNVVLSGEAYFEVAKNTKQPFIVKSEEQEVTVLGTHFNINTYQDEGASLTTLVEGSVSVSIPGKGLANSTILKPNQQSILTNGKLSVKTVDSDVYTAWKDDLLVFKKASLKSIMLTLSRWYDFNVNVSEIPDVTMSGEILQDVKLSEVLTMLQEISNLKFKIISDGIDQAERRVIIE